MLCIAHFSALTTAFEHDSDGFSQRRISVISIKYMKTEDSSVRDNTKPLRSRFSLAQLSRKRAAPCAVLDAPPTRNRHLGPRLGPGEML
eukprot:scaffold743_cov37-Tisochrysis_lutea.AAC.2